MARIYRSDCHSIISYFRFWFFKWRMSELGHKRTLSEPIKRVCYRGLSGRNQRRSRHSCGASPGAPQYEPASRRDAQRLRSRVTRPVDTPADREIASAACLKPIPRELPDVRPDISLTGRIKRDGCRDCEVRVRVVSTFRVEHLIARARRLDLERLQLGHQSVTKRQVVTAAATASSTILWISGSNGIVPAPLKMKRPRRSEAGAAQMRGQTRPQAHVVT